MARKAKKSTKKTAAAQPANVVSSTVFADRNGRVFHMDVKTQNAPGKVIMAAKDGRVTSIAISR